MAHFGFGSVIMNPDSLIKLARGIAFEAHEGQFRRGGEVPYIEHPRAVAERVGADPDAKVVAWLHDVLEDTHITADNLLARGIPQRLIDCVQLLTKSRETVYDAYLDRIAACPIAARVKVADMLSNLADAPSKKQIRKYAKGLLRLVRE